MTRARLVIVTGKGGVGRSTISAAVARLEHQKGRRVLAIDASAGDGLSMTLGRPLPPGKTVVIADDDSPVDDDRGSPVGDDRGSLSALRLTTEAALDEYVRMTLRAPISPRSLGPVARIFDFVATAAPAVREILTIGKIGHEVRRGPWDTVVVDGPATGHVVELLDAPSALGELVGIGPLAAESAWLTELLADADHTEVVLVTTPEELPVTETTELLARLQERTPCRVSTIVANRMVTELGATSVDVGARLEAEGSPVATLARAALARSRRAQEELARLGELGIDVVTVEESPDPVTAARHELAVAWPTP